MWSEPFFRTDEEGRKIAILLMDTQGTFDEHTTLTQNATVFAISSLLSSVLIFNVMKTVGEDTLQFFDLFSNYAKLAIGNDKASNLKDNDDEALIILIRDMDFPDYEYGYYDDRLSPPKAEKNLKAFFLDPSDTQPDEVRLTREHISGMHRNIGLYAMPEPGKQLTRYNNVEKMDEDFVWHLEEFVKLMMTKKQACKRICGKKVLNLTRTLLKKN